MTRRKLNIDRAIKIGGYYSLECSSDEEGLGFVRSCVDERERDRCDDSGTRASCRERETVVSWRERVGNL